MKLKILQRIVKIDPDNLPLQLQVLGYDISKLSVKEMEDILKKEINVDFNSKYKKYIFLNNRLFKVQNDIEELNAGEYSYFKQVLGDINGFKVKSMIRGGLLDGKPEEIVEQTDEEKVNKLFEYSHKLSSVFLTEKTFWKKKLNFSQKQELLLDTEVNKIIPLVFFLFNWINSSQRNIMISYINLVNQKLLNED